ncbi:hypothetical protein MKW94_011596, partial [Papaver nudicaule]|nr:hypothetical protein [Papaver nudicaule]
MDAEEGYSNHKAEEDQDYGKKKKKKKQRISLPSELILEFLSRLPIKPLTRLSCTSKYLYNYINQNPQFAKSHMINYSPKHPSLVFYIMNGKEGIEHHSRLCRNLLHGHDDAFDYHETIIHKTIGTGRYEFLGKTKWEFGGYCNGLVCFINMITPFTLTIDVWNCTTNELLSILPPVIEHHSPRGGCRGNGYLPMSCGFGFDSIDNEYKFVFLVIMIRTRILKCLVYTFGTKSSWTQVSLPTYYYPIENHASRLATFASYEGGALFWRTCSHPRTILLFDLHEHKLKNIQIPLRRNKSPAVPEEYRLFEYKGILGVAVLGKKSPVVLLGTSAITTLEKVHLKILKAYKHEHEWVELETVDLSSYSIPFTWNSQLVSICDQVLLYWSDTCKGFQIFNLHKKCLKAVRNLDPCFFNQISLRRWLTGLDNCWLHCEVENICSLKTLLPKRAQQVPDRASLNSIMFNGCHELWFSPKPKTVGGIFTSYYQSKSNEHYCVYNNVNRLQNLLYCQLMWTSLALICLILCWFRIGYY